MNEGRRDEAQVVLAALAGDTINSQATLLQTRLISQVRRRKFNSLASGALIRNVAGY